MMGSLLLFVAVCLAWPDVRKKDNSGRAGWEPGAGSFGAGGCSMVSAYNGPGLPFFIALCVFVPVPQQASLCQGEERSSAWTSCLGLKAAVIKVLIMSPLAEDFIVSSRGAGAT